MNKPEEILRRNAMRLRTEAESATAEAKRLEELAATYRAQAQQNITEALELDAAANRLIRPSR